jgi:hypothetical protein
VSEHSVNKRLERRRQPNNARLGVSAEQEHACRHDTYLIRETLLEERCGDGGHGRHVVIGNNCVSGGEDVGVLLGAKVGGEGWGSDETVEVEEGGIGNGLWHRMIIPVDPPQWGSSPCFCSAYPSDFHCTQIPCQTIFDWVRWGVLVNSTYSPKR